MTDPIQKQLTVPESHEDLKRCVAFHGHLCPGLVYGYLVAKQVVRLLDLQRSQDEEVVAIAENDSCAVDALQVLLGTTAGKGNLIIKDYGKNVFTVLNRSTKRAFRFSRRAHYRYESEHSEEFLRLDSAITASQASKEQRIRHRLLKVQDLLSKPFDSVYSTQSVEIPAPPYAPVARSEPCCRCQEMTMSTKMLDTEGCGRTCRPCAELEHR